MIFEESDGRLWASSTSMMAPDLDNAELFVDRLNETLGIDIAEWSALAARAFAVGSEPPSGDGSKTSAASRPKNRQPPRQS